MTSFRRLSCMLVVIAAVLLLFYVERDSVRFNNIGTTTTTTEPATELPPVPSHHDRTDSGDTNAVADNTVDDDDDSSHGDRLNCFCRRLSFLLSESRNASSSGTPTTTTTPLVTAVEVAADSGDDGDHNTGGGGGGGGYWLRGHRYAMLGLLCGCGHRRRSCEWTTHSKSSDHLLMSQRDRHRVFTKPSETVVAHALGGLRSVSLPPLGMGLLTQEVVVFVPKHQHRAETENAAISSHRGQSRRHNVQDQEEDGRSNGGRRGDVTTRKQRAVCVAVPMSALSRRVAAAAAVASPQFTRVDQCFRERQTTMRRRRRPTHSASPPTHQQQRRRLLVIGHSHTRYMLAMLCMMLNLTKCNGFSDHQRNLTTVGDDVDSEMMMNNNMLTFLQANYDWRNKLYHLLISESSSPRPRLFSSFSRVGDTSIHTLRQAVRFVHEAASPSSISSSSPSSVFLRSERAAFLRMNVTNIVLSRGSWDLLFLDANPAIVAAQIAAGVELIAE